MVTSLPLSENNPFRKIVIFLTLLLCEINFEWTVKEEVTEIFENILICNVKMYFCDMKELGHVVTVHFEIVHFVK